MQDNWNHVANIILQLIFSWHWHFPDLRPNKLFGGVH